MTMLAADLVTDHRLSPAPFGPAGKHLSAFLAEAAERFPDDACRVDDLELTYQAAWIQVLRIATWLQQNGVSRSDKVLMVLRQRPEMQLITLAIAHIGAVVTILSPHEREGRFRQIVEETQPSCMFLERSTGHLRRAAEEVLTVWVGGSSHDAGTWDAEYEELMSTAPAFGMRFPGTAQDPALLVYPQSDSEPAGTGTVFSHDQMRLLLTAQAKRSAAAMDPMEFFQTSAREQVAASAAFAALADRI